MTEILAMAAENSITPPVGTELLEPRWKASTGVHDDLYARALALSDGRLKLAIVCLDLIGLDLELVEAIRQSVWEKSGLPAHCLMLNCSHAHNTPTTIPWGHLAQTRRNRAWEKEMVEKVAATVARALEGLQPARLFAGRAAVQIGFNRRVSLPNATQMAPNAHGPVAPWVEVLRVDRSESGEPQAVLFSHAAHPVAVHIADTQVSADYPGFAARALSQELGQGVVAMFAQGCCGDINVHPLAGGFEAARDVGERLAKAAAQAAREAAPLNPGPLAAILKEVRLPFELPDLATAERLLQRARQGQAALQASQADEALMKDQPELIRWAEKMVAAAQEEPAGLPFGVQGFALGREFVLLGLTHEVFADYQLSLQAHSSFLHTLVTGYTNGCIDYIPTAEALYLGGYEVQGGPKYYGQPPLRPACEAIVKEAGMEVLEALYEKGIG